MFGSIVAAKHGFLGRPGPFWDQEIRLPEATGDIGPTARKYIRGGRGGRPRVYFVDEL